MSAVAVSLKKTAKVVGLPVPGAGAVVGHRSAPPRLARAASVSAHRCSDDHTPRSASAWCRCCFFSSRSPHTRCLSDWSSDVCSSDLTVGPGGVLYGTTQAGGSGSVCQANESGCGTVFQLTPPATPGGAWRSEE